MSIKGNTVGTPMPRTDYNQTDPSKADYLRGRENLNKNIADAKKAGTDAQTAANNAQTAANNAHTAANNAKTTADNALPKAGGTVTGNVAMSGKKVTGLGDPTDSGDAVNKGYVDGKRKVFSVTLTVNDWSSAAPYTQVIGIDGILATDYPHITPVYADDIATALAQKEAWSMVCEAESGDDSITFTCFEDKPETAIPLQIEVNR